jgi:hypothetical protein
MTLKELGGVNMVKVLYTHMHENTIKKPVKIIVKREGG